MGSYMKYLPKIDKLSFWSIKKAFNASKCHLIVMIFRRRRALLLAIIVIWFLAIIYFVSDSRLLSPDPPKVSLSESY